MYAGQLVSCQSSDPHKQHPDGGKILMSESMDTRMQRIMGNGRNCLLPSQKKFHAVKRLEALFRLVSATAWQSPRRGFGQPVAWTSRPGCYCSAVDSVGLAARRGWLAGTAPSAQCAVDPEEVAYADCHDHQRQHGAWISSTLRR